MTTFEDVHGVCTRLFSCYGNSGVTNERYDLVTPQRHIGVNVSFLNPASESFLIIIPISSSLAASVQSHKSTNMTLSPRLKSAATVYFVCYLLQKGTISLELEQ